MKRLSQYRVNHPLSRYVLMEYFACKLRGPARTETQNVWGGGMTLINSQNSSIELVIQEFDNVLLRDTPS